MQTDLKSSAESFPELPGRPTGVWDGEIMTGQAGACEMCTWLVNKRLLDGSV